MSRLITVCGLLLLSGVLVLVRAGTNTAPEAAEKPQQPLATKLFTPVKFAGFDDPNMKLKDALENLEQQQSVNIEVNEKAFEAEGMNDVMGTLIAEKPIRKYDKIRLDRLLRKIVARIPVPSGATYVLRRDGIEITTNQFARA